ncbi:hypothetical protein K435DRAFT_670801, partial [Dendrothele bispora CBS 962.96]
RRRLAQDIKNNAHPTARELTTLVERRTRLSRAIGRFRAIQATYTPAALQALAQMAMKGEKEGPQDENPEDIRLVLPSDLSPQEREHGCRSGLLDIELKLREAQMRQALDQVRNHLHIRARLVTYRDSTVRHQAMLTRSRAMIARNDTKTEAHKKRYQAAWNALSRDADVRCMSSESDKAWKSARKMLGKKKQKEMESEGQKDLTEAADQAELTRDEIRDRAGNGYTKTSWIWMEGRTGDLIDEECMRDGIRVEFCKAYARCRRWTEEVLLLREEMHRSLVSLAWKAQWWEDRVKIPTEDDTHAEGAAAYAYSQAAVMKALRDRFESLWDGYKTLEEVDEESDEVPKEVSDLLVGGDADGQDALDEEEMNDEDEDDAFLMERDLGDV